MGLTNFSTELILRHHKKDIYVIELGAQNLFHSDYPAAPYASEWYKNVLNVLHYACIDMNGENGAFKLDLSQPITMITKESFDLVTDFGTSEHVGINGKHDLRAYYNCWKTKFDICASDGLIISENPKTGNWPGHGFNYITKSFYEMLAELTGLEILELGENAAMGNVTDGWNIHCVLRKNEESKWLKFSEFKTLPVFTK